MWRTRVIQQIRAHDYECGMFVILYAECMSAGKRLDSCQAHMPRLRAQVAYQLKDQHISWSWTLICSKVTGDVALYGMLVNV